MTLAQLESIMIKGFTYILLAKIFFFNNNFLRSSYH